MGMDFPFLLNREDKGDSELKLSIYSSFYDELLEINWITGDLRPKILELGSIQGPLFDLFYESVLHWNCYVSQSNYSRARETALDADYDSDGVAYFYDFDADNDGTLDPLDFFPNDPSEIDDSDEDGIGNNADPDDDNDGFTDEEELADGTNPLSRFSCRSGCFSFDIDENKEAKALSDGLLVIRHLFGFSGESLTSGATTTEGARTSAEAISGYLSDADSELDIDGDGQSKALTDGLLLIRYLFGFSGDSLTAGAIGEGAERTTAEEIEAYIGDRVPQT